MTYINLLLIGAIWVFILDLTPAWDDITTRISSWITAGKVERPFYIKPFCCSLCMTFWTCLIYLIASHNMTLYTFAFGCLVAFLTPRIKDVMVTIDTWLGRLFNLLNR